MDIILCIPGPWTDREDLLNRITNESGEYLYSGNLLMEIESHKSINLQFETRDERIPKAFEAAGAHWRETEDMARITDHQSVVYLIGEGGSMEAAHDMMRAASALLRAGGMAVKVESSGIAHTAKTWLNLTEDEDPFKAHEAYVVYVMSDEVYSCGMHTFGLPDAVVDIQDAEEPAELLKIFTYYVLSESPVIKDGQTFSTHEDSAGYRIKKHPGIHYGEDSLFTNHYGTWKLVALNKIVH